MSCTMHSFLHSLTLPVTLTLISFFVAPQATAHHPHPIMFPTNPGTQPGIPVWAAPRFPGFQEPQHFLPFFPFPGNGMPSMPAGPTYPSLPSGLTFPSLPSGPNFPSLPSVPTFPSSPTAPTEPTTLPSFPDPSDQKDIPPSFPEPSAKLIENAPGTRTIP